MTLREYRARLGRVEQAIDDAISTGASYSVPGAGSVTNHSLDALYAERSRLRRQILALQGQTRQRTLPDFSCNSSDSNSSALP